MDNYYKFTKYDEDGLAMDIFFGFSSDRLKEILDDYFNETEYFLTLFAHTFKRLFKGADYDEFYYQALALIEQINDIKVILNILKDRDINE